jgi:hypothetical protein
MTLQEIFERVMIDSGQFLISIDEIELDVPRFKILVQHSLAFYSRYSPIVDHILVDIENSESRQFVFTESMYRYGIPNYISDLIPIRISGVVPYYLREYDRPRSNIDIKVEFPWVYRRPILTVPTNAQFDVKAVYHHKLRNIGTDQSPLWDIQSISDEDQEFFDLVAGRFMIAIGRNRRAFTIQELPIQVDASTMVDEGKTKEETAKREIQENKIKFYLGWG